MIKKRSANYGLAPGTPVHIGGGADGTRITMVRYNQHHFTEEIATFNGNFVPAPDDSITWINVEGLLEISLLENIGDYFKLHSLVLEDIVNTDHRPKMEDYHELQVHARAGLALGLSSHFVFDGRHWMRDGFVF